MNKNTRRYIKIVFALTISFGILAANPAVANPISASFTVDRTAALSLDRLVVTVTGTYICGPILSGDEGFGFGQLTITVSQPAGRQIATGWNATTQLECDGTSQDFEMQVQTGNIPLHAGPATVHGNIFVQSCPFSGNCEQVFSDAFSSVMLLRSTH
jgi:hypothetical protein